MTTFEIEVLIHYNYSQLTLLSKQLGKAIKFGNSFKKEILEKGLSGNMVDGVLTEISNLSENLKLVKEVMTIKESSMFEIIGSGKKYKISLN